MAEERDEWRVVWTHAARRSLLTEVRTPQKRQDIAERVESLGDYPYSGEAIHSREYGTVRRLTVSPFIVLYLPVEEVRTCVILAVRYGRRNWRI
jgi:plasmid stabilization system protein ParE